MNYLSSQEILYIHSRITTELEGKQGLKDTSVLKRGVKYIHDNKAFPDKFKKTAGIFFLIAKKKPFVSGNIPTALFVTSILMRLNKQNFDLSSEKVADFIENNLKNANLEDISSWIQDNSSPVKKD